MRAHSSKQSGFSLIELLIVVTVIGIIVSLAIPYMEQAKQSARGGSAINSLRLIASAEVSYRAINGNFGDRVALGNANLLNDPDLKAGRKSHYDFNVTPGDAALGFDDAHYYSATATPSFEPARWTHYFVDASGVMRSAQGTPATTSSAALQ